MVLEFFKKGGVGGFETIDNQLTEMLADGRRIFETAMNTLLGGTDPAVIKTDLRETDRGINLAEQAIRRELLVHASVHGPTDVPLVLAYMSIVKDAERIGDYAKNIFDLARYGADFHDAEDRGEMIHYRDQVSDLIGDTAKILATGDESAAASKINMADDLLDDYDARVKAAFVYEGPAAEAVARALLYRYLKRITAHLMNMLSMLVVAVDRRDYYDEDKDTRT